jgi:hypothetical protein
MKIRSNDKLGYYTVAGQRVESKLDACVLASKLNVHPQWHFSDSVWHNLDWTQEPEIDILSLYRMRARQIREQYDYVIVNYSAGSDSHTLVQAFIDEGLLIDEIVTIWNRKHTSKVVVDAGVTTPLNVEAEFELTTRPALNWIQDVSPRTKITYLDISDSVIESFKNYDGEEWLHTTAEHLNPQFVTRWNATRTKEQLINLDRGLKTAVVFGVDKPRVCIKDGKYCLYFLDIIANNSRGGFNRYEYDNLDYVFFYWSPDLPEISVKQAHMIMRWFEMHPQLKPILQWPNTDYSRRNAYEIISRTIVYPQWDIGTFQCSKTSSSVFSEWDQWFFKEFQGTRVMDNWYKGVHHVETNIDKRFLKYDFEDKFDGLVGMINGHFYLNK